MAKLPASLVIPVGSRLRPRLCWSSGASRASPPIRRASPPRDGRGWPGLVYYRLHGSPRTYYSAYPPATIRSLDASLLPLVRRATVWCIFDNTAAGAAAADAVALRKAYPAAGGA
jgi:uncharacterized protein YecE (DUF72 family)